MSKVKFIDLPEGVQIMAADMLKQQMECVVNGEWCAEATRIANAFLSMYESSAADVTIEGKLTFTKEQLDAAFKHQSPGFAR